MVKFFFKYSSLTSYELPGSGRLEGIPGYLGHCLEHESSQWSQDAL